MEKEYIERDEAIRKAIDACIKVVGHGITQFDAVDIAEMIESIPAADVVDVRHGVWNEKHGESYLVSPMKYDENGEPILQEYSYYECSLCGRIEEHPEPYCNCGAKMGEVK